MVLNQKPLKIYPITDTNGLNSLRITDDKGDNYTFVGSENEKNITLDYTGFALNKIVSANLKHTISFTTNPTTTSQYRRFVSQYEVLQDKWAAVLTEGSRPVNGQAIEADNGQHYDINRIMEIDFEQGTVEFVLKGGAGLDKDLIDYIQLKDRNGTMLRKIKFTRDPLHVILGANGTTNLTTHKLASIEIQDKNSNVVETYAFDHYQTIYTALDAAAEVIDSRFIDYWGYYNASGQTNMIPQHNLTDYAALVNNIEGPHSVGNPEFDRDPRLSALTSGVLRKIYYPTGGSTEFGYDYNKYENDAGSIKNGPGLRVKEIINSDGNGNTINRTFKYSTSASTFTDHGYIDLEPKLEYMTTTHYNRTEPVGDDHRYRTFYSGFIPSVQELASRPIRYTYVTEYKGSTSDNIGMTVYEYDNYGWTAAPIYPVVGTGEKINFHIPNYRYWDTPMLKHQTDFKAVKDGGSTTYDERRKISNVYNANVLYNIEAMHVQRNYIFPLGEEVLDPEDFTLTMFIEELFYENYSKPVYAYGPYSIPVGTKNLTSTTETLTNDDGSTVSTFTSYVYNTNNYVSEVHAKTSKTKGTLLENLVQKKEITYPFDYSNDPALSLMDGLNMLQYKVEEKDYLDGQLTNSSKINYKDWDDTVESAIAPEIIESSKGSGTLEPRVIYQAYDDKGNPEEIYKDKAPHTYYIWGYQQTKPIAKIDNFTSGEALGIQALIDSAVSASDVDNDNCKDVNCKEQELRDALALIQNNSALDTAQMSYFTYDPLIGATSMTDPRGTTVYYVYDAFNRLKEVRDADGNLVTDYDYSYKQPVSN